MKEVDLQSATAEVEVTQKLLRSWPLPSPAANSDKEDRGRILIVAGSREVPGAAVLAATAALRAGAGKLTLITGKSVARVVAGNVPEARVIGLPETSTGGLYIDEIRRIPTEADAVLIGPGMQDEAATLVLTQQLLAHVKTAQCILDAVAMSFVARRLSAISLMPRNCCSRPMPAKWHTCRDYPKNAWSARPKRLRSLSRPAGTLCLR